MYAMCDVLAKHHPGNGMIEHGRLLLGSVPNVGVELGSRG